MLTNYLINVFLAAMIISTAVCAVALLTVAMAELRRRIVLFDFAERKYIRLLVESRLKRKIERKEKVSQTKVKKHVNKYAEFSKIERG